MHRRKIIGACIIFLSLFIGAWKLENNHKRVFVDSVVYNPQLSEVIPINTLNIPYHDQRLEIFKSREYVRILGIMEE
jgi:hypothetical protein